jgi:hypothetical protein
MHAVKWGTSRSISALLEHGADPAIEDDDGNTAFLITRNADHVKLLVDANPDAVNVPDENGMTVLMRYCAKEAINPWDVNAKFGAVYQLLLSAEENNVRVDVNARSSYGSTALQFALQDSSYRVVCLLLYAGASVFDDDGRILMAPFEQEPCRWRTNSEIDVLTSDCIIALINHVISLGFGDSDQSEDTEEESEKEEEEEEEDVQEKENEDEPVAKRRRL